jgi:hypothetical protein
VSLVYIASAKPATVREKIKEFKALFSLKNHFLSRFPDDLQNESPTAFKKCSTLS